MLDLPSPYNSPEEYTEDLCDFIDTPLVSQITGGIHVNDALIRDAWQRLPEEWTSWWSLFHDHRHVQQDLIDGIRDKFEQGSDIGTEPALAEKRPQSLSSWLAKIGSLALPRNQRQGPVLTLPEILTARMNTKKIAEVSKAAAYIHAVCQRRGIAHVIDMGSGQGYLSSSLAYLFSDLKVLAIDGSQSQVEGAQLFAASLKIPKDKLEHMVHWVDGSPPLVAKMTDWSNGQKCMLVGLHACGNLSEHMLRYFATVSCIDSLAAIGCCYNHIVPASSSCPEGFPISSVLRNKNVALSPTALMIACQAPNNWGKPNLEKANERVTSAFSKRRLYRAILEKVFFDKDIRIHEGGRAAWGIRKGDLVSFPKFANRAMGCLGVGSEEITIEELVMYEKRYKHCEGQIAILWTLSVLCWKVVESVIAMDRYWFLAHQDGIEVEIFPIFDFKVSPRNLILVAEKTV
ncbi:hypothetical protein S40285_09521 [Stachybotrys chlorohalonatus IBT 40285]|uniref:Methyltransferase domain-containing protein n=1 Tax=Stachybotrys chlorohalonatus (strain IBT 40285) TaxID=1283841 RepID=A0A084QVR4_STAC4|nr:hypothetical protein S40285_09521 [Stachybotrys chlorohalonata IBT 40285]